MNQPVTIGSRTYTGYTLHFQGGVLPMPITDLAAFNKFWNP